MQDDGGIIRQNSGLAVDQDESCYHTAAPTPALVSGTVDFVLLE